MQKRVAMDPGQILRWIATRPKTKSLSLECGAGFGEVTAAMRGHFVQAIATDITPPKAPSPYGVAIVRAAAEQLPVAPNSVDLLISMQALHYFDTAAHLAEARRVLRPGGVFAALCWGEIVLPEAVLRAYGPVLNSLAPYWETPHNWVLTGYAGLPLLGRKLALPKAAMTRPMTLGNLGTEIQRWSATRNAIAANADIAKPDLTGLNLREGESFAVHWPILGQVFQI